MILTASDIQFRSTVSHKLAAGATGRLQSPTPTPAPRLSSRPLSKKKTGPSVPRPHAVTAPLLRSPEITERLADTAHVCLTHSLSLTLCSGPITTDEDVKSPRLRVSHRFTRTKGISLYVLLRWIEQSWTAAVLLLQGQRLDQLVRKFLSLYDTPGSPCLNFMQDK